MMIGSVLAGHPEDAEKWHRIGDMIGLAFQIQDDILDVRLTPEEFGKSTSDSDNEKVTCVSIYGIETAERMMNSLYDEAIRLVLSFGAFDAAGIIAMIEQIRGRTM
jgi:geranylgeranyl pyrophosphate synthase